MFRLRSLACALVVLAGLSVGTGAAQAAPTELFFSEYIEGSSNNKALEIYNGTSGPVPLDGYDVQMCFNGNTACTLTIPLDPVTLAPGAVYVLAQSSANATILAQADQTNGSGWFNGDDAVLLRKAGVVVDSLGQRGLDPGTEWGTGLTSTADNTLRRKATVEAGDAVDNDVFDPSVSWTGFAQDTFDGLGSQGDNELAPSVASTSPAAGATGVAREANIAITFSEPVTVSGSWFTITCSATGAHAAAVSGGPTTYTLDPGTSFASNETCTVTIAGANVSDVDGNDPPDTMAADVTFGFTVADVFACGEPATRIHAIQGAGATAAQTGSRVIEGVVVGDYQGAGQFSGYFVQEETGDQDTNPLTSEGIFVFNTSFAANVGDVVRVRGTAGEFGGMTQLSSVNAFAKCGTGSVPATAVSLPVADIADHERFEGMLVRYDQTLTATEVFNLGRFGEVSLSGAGRLYNSTAVAAPGAAAEAVDAQNDRSRIILDDASNTQNNDPTLYPTGGLSATNTLRVGDTLPSLTGVLEFRFSAYRIQPVGEVNFVNTNLRPTAPAAVGGNLKVASFNVLNYFNDFGCADCRGAESQFEFDRQEAKIVSALKTIDADVVGLMEIENDGGPGNALAELTAALNEATAPGTYSFIDTGVIGTDAIKVALIYKPASVTPVGAWDILTTADDPRFIDTRNRPTLAQTFRHLGTGETLTVAVNHLKSKGSGCGGAPDDQPDTAGGNCNGTRTLAAAALADWLESDPTGSGDPDFLIIGDLNSYTFETPIQALENDGYTNLIRAFQGLGAYSYVFQGESGYLDHALATASLEEQVTGVTEWHINPDEPTVLDYNTNFKSAGHVETLYDDGPYRSSDHDPVIVGLQLDVSYATLCSLTRELVSKPGVADALCAKLAAAEAAEARGNENAKAGSLGAYVNQLEAQSGKSIAADAAAWLAGLAGNL